MRQKPLWLLVAFFVFGGVVNLVGPEQVVTDFAGWGYPRWFHLPTGLMELAAATLLAFKRTRIAGAVTGAAVMTGAALTVLMHGEWLHAIAPVAVLAILALVVRDLGKAPKEL